MADSMSMIFDLQEKLRESERRMTEIVLREARKVAELRAENERMRADYNKLEIEHAKVCLELLTMRDEAKKADD